jgi:hypothetical protein
MNMSNTTAFAIVILLVAGGVFFQYKKYMQKDNNLMVNTEISDNTINPLEGRWKATPEQGNGEIIGNELVFTILDKEVILAQINSTGETFFSAPVKMKDSHTITLNEKNVEGKIIERDYRIDFTKEGILIVNYINEGENQVGEPATGFYKKVQ